MTPNQPLTPKEEGLLVAIITTGLIFRLALEWQGVGINLDETVTVYVASAPNFSELIERIATYEFSPPIYFLLMQQWVSVFGDKPGFVSIPSMISGTVLIPVVFIFVKELFRRASIALLAAFFAAVSPLAVFFSHEARLYSLFALIMTLTLWAFVRCLRESTLVRLSLLTCLTALLLYCHYIAIFICGLLVLSAGLLSLLKKRDKSGSTVSEWNFSLTRVAFSLMIAGVLFLPWSSVFMRHREVGTYWVDSKPLLDWPFVFASNMAATLPFPWIVGFCLTAVMSPIVVVGLLVFLSKRYRDGSLVSSGAFPYWLLSLNLLVPISILGYVTPFILGYCRYMVPFAVLSWALLAGISVFCATIVRRKVAARSSTFICVFLLVALGVMNFAELKSQFFGIDRSGLRRLALDVKNGKYSDTAFIVAPDFNSATFIYYLTREQGLETPLDYYTYPRVGTLTPAAHKGYSDVWLAEGNTIKAMDWIARLDPDNTHSLAVVSDLNAQDSKMMPAKRRVQELLNQIKRRYGQAEISVYQGGERSFEVYRFKLK